MESRIRNISERIKPVQMSEQDYARVDEVKADLENRKTIKKAERGSDKAVKRRIRKFAATSSAGLALMGGVGVQASEVRGQKSEVRQSQEVLNQSKSDKVSSQEIHDERVKFEGGRQKTEGGESQEIAVQAWDDREKIEKDSSLEIQNSKNLEPAVWWPVAVKQNWLQIQKTAEQYNIDPYLVATIVAEESGGQNINNKSGAMGLMQIMPATAGEIARLRKIAHYNISNPEQNLDFGCWLVDYITDKYIIKNGVDPKSDLGIAMLAVGYGEGEGALQLWMRNGYDKKLLNQQATKVIPLWQDMFRNRNSKNGGIFSKDRGRG